MKSTYSKYVVIAAMGLLTACSAEDSDIQNDAIHEPVVLNASLAASQVTTRAITNQGNTTDLPSPIWGSDLLIALAFSDKNDMTSASAINAKVKKYRVKENANPAAIAPFDAQNTHYWTSKTKTHYVCGWCTKYNSDKSSASYNSNIPTAASVIATQSSWNHIDCRDFLFAPVQAITYPTSSSSSVINFYHQKAMVDIRFNFSGTSYSLSNLSACQLDNVYPKGDWQYPITGNYGTFTFSSSETLANIKFFKSSVGFGAMMIPQDIGGKTLTFTSDIANNTSITFTFPDEYVLEPGKYYVLTFYLSQEKVLYLKTQITDWVAAPVITGNLNL